MPKNLDGFGGLVVLFLFYLACFSGLFILIKSLTWVHRLWTSRGLHRKEYEKYSKQARELAIETMSLRILIEYDLEASLPTQTAHKDVLKTASEWDTGISIALAAWKDCVQSEDENIHGQDGKSSGDAMLRKRQKSHMRYVIGLMRSRCKEGLQRRRELSPELQGIPLDIARRWEGIFSVKDWSMNIDGSDVHPSGFNNAKTDVQEKSAILPLCRELPSTDADALPIMGRTLLGPKQIEERAPRASIQEGRPVGLEVRYACKGEVVKL